MTEPTVGVEGQQGIPVTQVPGWHTHPECLLPGGGPLSHMHGMEAQPEHTHLPQISWGPKQDRPERSFRPRQVVRPAVIYEYLCASCREPLIEPEYEGTFRLMPAEDREARNITDYGDSGDTYEVVEGYPEAKPGRVDTPLDLIVHAWHRDKAASECWHWCSDGEVQRIGPADACPLKDTHDE